MNEKYIKASVILDELCKRADQDAIEMVMEFVDALPHSNVVELPCSVGDTVWFLEREWLRNEKRFASVVRTGYVKAIKFSARPTKITVEYASINDTNGRCKGVDYFAGSIGRTLHLSEESANAALTERTEENDR